MFLSESGEGMKKRKRKKKREKRKENCFFFFFLSSSPLLSNPEPRELEDGNGCEEV